MSDRRPAAFLVCVCALLAAAQIFAVLPQLHACALGASGLSAGSAGTASAALRGPRRGKALAGEECTACRIANLALVMQGELPLSAPSTRDAEAVQTPPESCRWLRLDNACGRAPPRL
jgi:hypothetical protein